MGLPNGALELPRFRHSAGAAAAGKCRLADALFSRTSCSSKHDDAHGAARPACGGPGDQPAGKLLILLTAVRRPYHGAHRSSSQQKP